MPKPVRAVTAALACLALAVPLAGCGEDNDTANAYVDAVNAAQTDFADTFDALQQQITTRSTPEEDARTLGRFEEAIDDVVADLRAVEAPADVEELHADLIAAIAEYGDTIAAAREEFSSDDPAEILAARTQLSTDVSETSSRINRAIDAINTELRD